jgi:excisionase family DNA binding protein
MTLLTNYDVAEMLGVAPQTVYNKPWRARIGLPAVKVGSSLRFRREDVERIIEAGLEVLPRMPSLLAEANQ